MASWRALTVSEMANVFQIDAAWVQGNFPALTNVAMLGQGGQKVVFAAQHPTDGEVVLKLVRPGQHNVATDRQFVAVNVVRSPRVPRILEEGSVQTPFGDLA